MASLPLGVLVVVSDVCKPRKTEACLGPLKPEVHPPSLSQQAIFGDGEEVDL